MPRVALIVNPVATRLRRPVREATARALAPVGLEWVMPTRGPGEGAELARRAADLGAEVVVTLGGDGTAADVAGALAGRPVAMAPLPAGGTNVFGRAAGWPASLPAAVASVAASVAAGEVRMLTLGRLSAGPHERTFCVNAGVGIDGETVEWIEARPRLKRRLRQAGFVAGAAVAGTRRRPPALLLRVDGGTEIPVASLIAACGGPYAWLGSRPLDLVPGASFDGVLAWLGILRARPLELARLAGRALRGGGLEGEAALVHGRAGDLLVRAGRPAAVQADGEPLGRHAEVRLRAGPVLRVLAVAPSRSRVPGGPPM